MRFGRDKTREKESLSIRSLYTYPPIIASYSEWYYRVFGKADSLKETSSTLGLAAGRCDLIPKKYSIQFGSERMMYGSLKRIHCEIFFFFLESLHI